jgi:hypothetical protein
MDHNTQTMQPRLGAKLGVTVTPLLTQNAITALYYWQSLLKNQRNAWTFPSPCF